MNHLKWVGSLACAALIAIVAYSDLERPADACGGTPPPPVCGKSLVFSKAVPGTVLLTEGGEFTVESLVYLAMSPLDACPSGPYLAEIDVDVLCDGGPDGEGSTVVEVGPGYNFVEVDVTVPAGPARLCDVVATCTVTMSDGMALTQTADSIVCIADPTPTVPNVPRLDLDHLIATQVTVAHPGDQVLNRYRLTNNDQENSWEGTVTVDMVNVADLPDMAGPVSPLSGPYAISDPGGGDNFVIALEEDTDGCIVLPGLPHLVDDSIMALPVTLAPEESIQLAILTRSWGMCADGSCSESRIIAEGEFSNAEPGLACAGSVVAVDVNQRPQYACPDSGSAMQICPPVQFDPFLQVSGSPRPDPAFDWSGEVDLGEAGLAVDGDPVEVSSAVAGICLQSTYGRLQQQLFDPKLTPIGGPGSSYAVTVPVQVTSSDVLLGEVDIEVTAGAPNGHADVAPIGHGSIPVDNEGNGTIDSSFDLLYQVSGQAIDASDNRFPLQIVSLDLVSAGTLFEVSLVAQPLPGELGPDPIIAIELYHDIRGFARTDDPPSTCPQDVDGDGVVEVDDLVAVILNWGCIDPPPFLCEGDVNGDGTVDVDDLTGVILAWGDC